VKLLREFKAFAMRGNVIDLAVGVIIGGAFSKIVASLVEDLFMPLIGLITGGFDISSLTAKVGDGENAAVFAYGKFITTVVDFLMIALCVFIFVKLVSQFHRKKEEVAEAPRTCPYCMEKVDKQATRCPHCTSQI